MGLEEFPASPKIVQAPRPFSQAGVVADGLRRRAKKESVSAEYRELTSDTDKVGCEFKGFIQGVHTCTATCASWSSIFIFCGQILFVAGVRYHLTAQLNATEAPIHLEGLHCKAAIRLRRGVFICLFFDRKRISQYFLSSRVCKWPINNPPVSCSSFIYSQRHPQKSLPTSDECQRRTLQEIASSRSGKC